MARARRIGIAAAAAVCGALALLQLGAAASGGAASAGGSDAGLVQRGRALFAEECASCHGAHARGVPGSGPSLRGAGAAAADFYLRTGRMPIDDPGEQPLRSHPRFGDRDIRALDAFVGSFGGPPIPEIHPSRGTLNEGLKLFTANCSGCHSISAKGGVVVGAYAPPLDSATATQVGEATRVGPYVMPSFGRAQISDPQLDSLARYVELAKHPDDAGGWGIGHIGPVPEGLVAWVLAGVALLLVARLIGERTD